MSRRGRGLDRSSGPHRGRPGSARDAPAKLGYAGLALLVGGESLGLILPGETAIPAAGVLAREGRVSASSAATAGALSSWDVIRRVMLCPPDRDARRPRADRRA
jgi:hypothetical protein